MLGSAEEIKDKANSTVPGGLCSYLDRVHAVLQFLLRGYGGNPELKETQLKRGEEDNMIHHI